MSQRRDLKHSEDGEHQELWTTTVHCGLLKKGLNCNDVKRWICADGIETRPYGYKEEKEDIKMKEGMKA